MPPDGHAAIWSFATDDARKALKLRDECVAAFSLHSNSAERASELDQIFGELVGNVVRHAPGPIRISLKVDGTVATLVVQDRGNGAIPTPRLPADAYSECGRGLFIVSQLVRRLRIALNPDGGASVYADLELR